ncbi:M1 family metallopeptidase [Thermoactinospora rubra]|uniref:M1 family metallopeptidase n=1 Tax=Thermoactinospora rubra TaxID=1088767 RepID=UPI000A11A939|nr:M1 family metallopeptidase [Thermoactinospora rubra]
MRSCLLVIVVLSLVAGCSPTNGDGSLPPRRTSSAVATGAPGIGDEDFPLDGNGGYDVRRYRLKLAYDPKRRHLDGTATVEATAGQSLARFNLDLSGLTVRSAEVDGRRAAFTRDGDELTLIPQAPVAKGARFTATVSYSGQPQRVKDGANLGTYGFLATPDGAYVVCQPNGAKTWFPANDHPADKARFDFEITVPKGLTALANGEMTKPPATSGGRTTFTWSERHPMATYLATMTLGRFEVRQGKTARGVPLLAAVDPRFRGSLDKVYTLSGQITDYWSGLFGEYPFGSTGGVVDDYAAGYALETQTKPMYGGFDPDESIMSHELAHQWFGNSLTIKRWRDLWLNEGFATYAEWLWAEHRGRASAESTFRSYLSRPASDAIWSYPPGRAKPDDLFHESVYIRGAMTLHALRRAVGDQVFFKLLKAWASEHRYGHVTTQQFIARAERAAGKDLDALFDTWLFTAGRPKAP